MGKDSEKTKVIFRTYKDGDVIAIFPEGLGNNNHWTCSSYMHIGQHGPCDPDGVIKITRPSTVEEYNDLKNELENQVGYNLEVIKRNRYSFLDKRIGLLEAKYD